MIGRITKLISGLYTVYSEETNKYYDLKNEVVSFTGSYEINNNSIILYIDNKEIVELCKKTSVNPRKDSKGQIYFSMDEVKKLKNAKTSDKNIYKTCGELYSKLNNLFL